MQKLLAAQAATNEATLAAQAATNEATLQEEMRKLLAAQAATNEATRIKLEELAASCQVRPPGATQPVPQPPAATATSAGALSAALLPVPLINIIIESDC